MKFKTPFTCALLSLGLLTFSACITDDYGDPYGGSYNSSPNYGAAPRYDDGGYYRGNAYYADSGYAREPPPRYAPPPPPPPRHDYRGDRHERHHGDRHGDHRHKPPKGGRSGEFNSGGDAKEFAFSKGYNRCTITVLEGTVGFRTIVVRRGSAKQPITINAKYPKGQSFNIPIDAEATGIRISDCNRGRYRVTVK